jgi:hypothetical protein
MTGLTIIQTTQHWRLIGGAWHRDVIARRHSDGTLRLVAVRDDLLPAVAA